MTSPPSPMFSSPLRSCPFDVGMRYLLHKWSSSISPFYEILLRSPLLFLDQCALLIKLCSDYSEIPIPLIAKRCDAMICGLPGLCPHTGFICHLPCASTEGRLPPRVPSKFLQRTRPRLSQCLGNWLRMRSLKPTQPPAGAPWRCILLERELYR